MKKIIPIIILFCLIFIIFLIRLFSPTEIDDLSPEIPCYEIEKYNPDILWIIPEYNNSKISENKTWCDEILKLNKTLGMHGITHTYEEFSNQITQEQLQEGIQVFENCFNFTPTMFKPPQLKISEENIKLIKQNNLTLKTKNNQRIHKVYHCNDSGPYKNWFINLF